MTLREGKLLDETGWRLLRALQEQARLSFRELGQVIGLTYPAAVERVRKLEDAGIIRGYHAEVDTAKLGLAIVAFVRVNVPGQRCAQFGEHVKDLPEVLEGHRVTGEESFVLKVAVASIPHLENLLDRILPFGQPTTSIVLSSPVTRRVLDRPLGQELGAVAKTGP